MPGYGNWCGPNWTAGQNKPASQLTEEDRLVPAVDGLDQYCKNHDIELHDHPENADEINRRFIEGARTQGLTGRLFALLVDSFGPSPSTSEMARYNKRLRANTEGDILETGILTDSSLRRANPSEALVTRQRQNSDISLPDSEDFDTSYLSPQYSGNHRRINDGGNTVNDRGQLGLPSPADRSNMQEEGTDQALVARATASTSTISSGVSKETPITLAQPSYGFQETHTTILPYTCWLTAALCDTGAANQVAIRMNAIHDFIATTITSPPGAGVAFATKGIYGVPASTTSGNQGTYNYPETMANGAVERPSFRDTWMQLYEYYTVLGCEYKITLLNASSTLGNRSIVGIQFDTYSDTAGTTGNIMPLTNLSEAMAYKNMQWKILGGQTSSDTQPAYDIIYGTYKPGQAKRNISNDGDVKTWTKTDGSLPTLKEFLTINCWRAPLAQQSQNTSVMMQLELKYIVQFKDLKTQARYPATVTAAGQNITINLTNNPADVGSALQKWT